MKKTWYAVVITFGGEPGGWVGAHHEIRYTSRPFFSPEVLSETRQDAEQCADRYLQLQDRPGVDVRIVEVLLKAEI